MSNYKIISKRNVPLSTQRKVSLKAKGFTNQVVVVRTLAGTFIGCIVDVIRGAILLRVFSGFDRVFVTITIPVNIIFDIFPFRCTN